MSKKLESTLPNMVIVLTLIAVVAGLALGYVNSVTAGPIEEIKAQQLSDGIKKLFGEEAAQTVSENAQNAYKTAGMSANQYMEQATTFSAALIKGLNGDTEEAARLTDVAIRAMSDNVNTFGTDAQSVQDAFNGFAKQNYTMLDNLKLGRPHFCIAESKPCEFGGTLRAA